MTKNYIVLSRPIASNRLLLFLTALLLLPFLTPAQLPGQKDSIYSVTMKEGRVLQIQLPKEFKAGSKDKYPVLYLTDGEWNAGLMAEVQTWSRQWGFNPPVIMVGIVNTYLHNDNQRGRDLTPTGKDGAGGGPAFLAFIKNELIPYINKTYPANGSNILWGHSLGGMFVLYTLFKEPQLFDSYIAADPSLWWDNGYMLKLADSSLGKLTAIKSLFITGRTGPFWHEMRIDSLEMLLVKKAPHNLQWKAVAYPDETHVSQQYKSAYDGLKYTLAPAFKDDPIHIDPMGGMLVPGKPFSVSCFNILPEKYIRYTTNGRMPQMSSPVFAATNRLQFKGPVELNIKSFFTDSSLDKSLQLKFSSGKALVPIAKPAGVKAGNFNYTCYSDSTKEKILSAGVPGPDKNLNELATGDRFFTVLSGWLQSEKAGYYVFEMVGEPGTRLFAGNRLLMEIAAGKDYVSFMVPLEKGFYPLRFEYPHRKNGNNFAFSYIIPGGIGDGSIPDSLMYYRP